MTVKVRKWKDGYYVVAHFNKKRKAKKFESEADAEKFAEDLRAHIRIHGTEAYKLLTQKRSPESASFRRYSARWLAEAKKTNLKHSTLQRYESCLKTHLAPYFGRLDVDQIDYTLMKQFCLEKQKDNSKHGVRLMVATMRVILREAQREGLIQANPATQLGQYFGTRTEGRAEMMPFNRKELTALLGVIQSRWPEYYEFVLCAARTGMALGEQRGLWWEDVDFQRKLIHVRRSWSYGRPITTPKTRSRIRKVDMSRELGTALKALRSRRKAEHLRMGRKGKLSEWVFLSKEGRPIHPPNFMRRVWYPAQGAANVTPRNWHNLRHTFASQLLMAGENPLYVCQQMGHSRVTTTHNHYAHWIQEEKASRGVNMLDEKPS